MAVFDQGMDVVAVAGAGAKLLMIQQQLNQVISGVDNVVSSLAKNWGGLDQSRFQATWQGNRGHLTTISGSVGKMGATCLSESAQQVSGSL